MVNYRLPEALGRLCVCVYNQNNGMYAVERLSDVLTLNSSAMLKGEQAARIPLYASVCQQDAERYKTDMVQARQTPNEAPKQTRRTQYREYWKQNRQDPAGDE